ncbi:RimK family alpha-L-glutamate ligase [Streptomyces sp. NPDC058773]|uniref:ATP-grasp domain-containing protein n=1 Tax=Streptomyces sp. NPDC058773 TaxID=3346632 RepID=UPI0036805C1F
MRIGLITADATHPVLAAASTLLTGAGHLVEILHPEGSADAAVAGPPADVYLLKARTPGALTLAARLEEHGAPVVNSAAATARCQDRVAMAARASGAGLPFARTRAVATMAELAAAGEPAGPLVVKSRHSRRGDLVARADDGPRLRELAADWPTEPVVVQEFTANSGWDHKVWVVDGQLFAGLRRSELAPPLVPHQAPAPDGRGPALPLPAGELPESWRSVALRVGEVFGLTVYGVDLLDAGGGAPLIVDVNAFPGIRGQAGAPEALAELALRTAARTGLSRGTPRP